MCNTTAVLLLCSFSQGSNNLGALFVLLRRSWKETTGLTSRGSRGLLDTFGRRCTAWSLTYIGWQAARVEFFFRSGIPCAFQPLTAPTPAYINQQQEEREGDYCTAVHAARSSHNRQPLLAPSCLTPNGQMWTMCTNHVCTSFTNALLIDFSPSPPKNTAQWASSQAIGAPALSSHPRDQHAVTNHQSREFHDLWL